MLGSVAGIALPLKLSHFEKNYSLEFHFAKRLFPHSACGDHACSVKAVSGTLLPDAQVKLFS